MKVLFISLLTLTGLNSLAADPKPMLKITGHGTTCEEASRDLMGEISYLNVDIKGISLSNCQSPFDFANVEKSAIIELNIPLN